MANSAKKAAPKASKTTKKDYKYFSGLNADELPKEINSLRQDKLQLKRGLIQGEVQNNKAYKAKRQELARALTYQNSNKEAK